MIDSSCSADEKRARSRAERQAARAYLWTHSTIERVSRCGRVPNGQLVALKVTPQVDGGSVAGWSGLQHCGSPWSCPTCSAQISRQRADELGQVVERWHRDGGRIVFVTLTVRHDRTQSLRTVWDAVGKGWAAATSGRGWVEATERFGMLMPNGKRKLHFARVAETTISDETGWHVHVHAMVFVRGDWADGQAVADLLGGAMWERWDRAVQRAGLRPGVRAASDARMVSPVAGGDQPLAEYFAKAVYELTGAVNKAARGGSLTPFQLLALIQAFEGGDLDALGGRDINRLRALWAEWEQVSRGRRQISYSRGLLRLCAVETLTDDEIVDDDQLEGQVILTLSCDQWKKIVTCQAQVLRAVEQDIAQGLALIRELLRR